MRLRTTSANSMVSRNLNLTEWSFIMNVHSSAELKMNENEYELGNCLNPRQHHETYFRDMTIHDKQSAIATCCLHAVLHVRHAPNDTESKPRVLKIEYAILIFKPSRHWSAGRGSICQSARKSLSQLQYAASQRAHRGSAAAAHYSRTMRPRRQYHRRCA